MIPEPQGVVLGRTHTDQVTPPPAGLRQPVVWLLAVATGAIAANLYYIQPLLHLIATTFGVSNGAVGLLVTVTQIGFAVGLVLLLPLADVVNGRRLFSALLVVNAAALVVVASAPDITAAIIGFAVVGLTNVAAQVIVPVAASMASDEQRGRVVGTVITGLLAGILLTRTVSGLISQAVGWRSSDCSGYSERRVPPPPPWPDGSTTPGTPCPPSPPSPSSLPPSSCCGSAGTPSPA